MITVYHMNLEKFVVLRPYMRWVPDVLKRDVTEDQWEDALREACTPAEYAQVLKGRERNV